MKQFKIIEAFKTTELLADNKNLSSSDQWEIYKLRKILRPHIEFQDERLEAIRNKYKEFADENGTIYGDDYERYNKEIEELYNLEVELDFEKPIIPMVDGITFKIIEPLEDFIEFIPE